MKTFLTLLFFPLAVLAQTETLGPDDLRDRAFQMAKATVEFLATDAKTYGRLEKTTCLDCADYAGLKAFINQQKLMNAGELVNETERLVTTTTKAPAQALTELRTQLITRVTAGSDHQHRRGLASFATYESQMNQLAGPPQTATPDATADLQNAHLDTLFAEETVTPLSKTPSADNGWLSKSGLALILSLLSLAVLSWLVLFRRKEADKGKPTDAGNEMKVAQLNDELVHVKGDLRRTIETNGKLQNRVEQLEKQVSVLQKVVGVASAVLTTAVTPPASGASAGTNSAKESQRQVSPNPASRQQTQPSGHTGSAPTNPVPATRSEQITSQPTTQRQPIPPAPAENRPRSVPAGSPDRSPTPRIFYARTVDLGDGFSAESLTETTTERPMVYQIQVVTPGQATFRVADDPYAQRLALSDPYSYLNDACEYTSQPASNSRIQTVKPGRLALQGSKWVIMEKAQIAFG